MNFGKCTMLWINHYGLYRKVLPTKIPLYFISTVVFPPPKLIGTTDFFFLSILIVFLFPEELTIEYIKCVVFSDWIHSLLWRFLCGHEFSNKLNGYLGAWIPDHKLRLFYLIRDYQAFLRSVFTILQSHQQGVWVTFAPHRLQQ